ncbi:hypothetical protein KW801_01820, partial [Candidatus Saccharibacteria bacterium]|nr:hypothetical protein [Candidatus Saccharibacteria bacterium]
GKILVTARISGPAITDPASITVPADGTHFSAVPIDVSGSCPTNAAYVEIFKNNVLAGSAICSAGNTFELQIDLFPGRNDLTAHSFNITDDEGPVSAIVTVYYDVPQPPPTPPGSTTPISKPSKPNPFLLKTAFLYKGYYTGQEVQWPVEIVGGNPPYALNVDWGDGQNSIISRKAAGEFMINHTYSMAGGYKGSYTIKIQASDTDSNYAYLQFFVIVTDTQTGPSIGNIYTKSPPTIGSLRHLLWVAWPAYISVLLMVVAFKLGEREEFLFLRSHGRLRRS